MVRFVVMSLSQLSNERILQSKMSPRFAVVYFVKDGTYSEIPTSWLIENNTRCKWPRSKNPANLIKRDCLPDTTNWSTHDIKVECYCDSLKKARNKAEDATYTSNDEDIGRGRRQTSTRSPNSFDTSNDSTSTDDNDSTPNLDSVISLKQSHSQKFFNASSKNQKDDIKFHQINKLSVINEDRCPISSTDAAAKITIQPDLKPSDCLAAKSNSQFVSDSSIQPITKLSCQAVCNSRNQQSVSGSRHVTPDLKPSDCLAAKSNSQSVSHPSIQLIAKLSGQAVCNSRNQQSVSGSRLQAASKTTDQSSPCSSGHSAVVTDNAASIVRQAPIIIEDILVSNTDHFAEQRTVRSNLATVQDIENVLLVCTETLEYVKSIAQAFKDLQVRTSMLEQTQDFFSKKLPIPNKKELDKFEEILKNNDHKSHFIEFIKSIGGRNHKELIHRLLKQIFTDEFAMKCYWLGQRNNHRICDLSTVKILKGFLATLGVQQSNFETITSEWFRLAKLRFDRYQKKKDNQPIQ